MSHRASAGNSSLRLLGCGCAVLVIAVAGAVVAFTYFAYSQAQDLAQGFTDPDRRAAKTRDILRYETLPEGYFPAGGMSLPVIFKTAILSDKQDLKPKGESDSGAEISADLFDRRGFFYVETPGFGRRGRDIEEYFEEGGENDQMATGVGDEDTGIDIGFDVREVLDRGEVPIPFGTARYVARRGTLNVEGEELPGLSTLFHLACNDDSRIRFGLWFTALEGAAEAPDAVSTTAETGVAAEAEEGVAAEAEPGSEPAALDLAGTPADPAALEDFLGHFEICG